MKNTIIALNGPKNSGKSKMFETLHQSTFLKNGGQTFEKASFKDRLIHLTCELYNINRVEWDIRYSREDPIRMKEFPWDKLQDRSQREALIFVSEKIIKPSFGIDYFGQVLAKRIKDSDNDLFIATSCGFIEEYNVLENDPDIQVCLVHVSREGCNFEGDSRDYIYPTNSPIYRIENDWSIETAVEKLRLIVEQMKL